MPYKTRATLTSKGQVTFPAELRRRWKLKPGDKIDFEMQSDEKVILTRTQRRSIFESRKELTPLSLGRPLKQHDIDNAVAEAMSAQQLRVQRRRSR